MGEKTRKSSDAHIKAVQKYRDTHYKRLVADIRPEEFEFINNLAKSMNISKAALIVNSLHYIADNNIDIKPKPDDKSE